MIAALDVGYDDEGALAAAVMLREWSSPEPEREIVVRQPATADYRPGEFYLRELGPLLAVVQEIVPPPTHLVIDAYCQLSADGAPGLGARLAELLPEGSAVVGVAKNRFRGTRHAAEVMRGGSSKPLFVTVVGADLADAARWIRSMHGEHRIPAMLRRVDRLSRGDR